jgi:hypothetical protein
MNLLLKTVVVAALGFLLGQVGGCASSSNLVDIWHDSSYTEPVLGKVLVIDVRRDAAKRRIWEDAFSDVLVKHGVVATSSYNLFPDATPDTIQVAEAVKANGFDGILVVMRRPSETSKHYVKGYTTVDQNVGYVSYWQRYVSYYREIEHPGYVDSQKVDIRAIDVTTTGTNGRLIWSATSKTPDPGSVVDVQRGIVDMVIEELVKHSIISK